MTRQELENRIMEIDRELSGRLVDAEFLHRMFCIRRDSLRREGKRLSFRARFRQWRTIERARDRRDEAAILMAERKELKLALDKILVPNWTAPRPLPAGPEARHRFEATKAPARRVKMSSIMRRVMQGGA